MVRANRTGLLSACLTLLVLQPASGEPSTDTTKPKEAAQPVSVQRPHEPDLSPKELEALWSDLASPQDRPVFLAFKTLTAAPKQAVPFLRERLKPPPPTVEQQQIFKLIAALDNDEFTVRERAAAELEKLGQEALPALRLALQNKPSLEVSRRIEQLMEKLKAPPLTPEQKRALLAVKLLERINTLEAREVLEKLVKESPDLSPAAKEALERLAKLPLAKP